MFFIPPTPLLSCRPTFNSSLSPLRPRSSVSLRRFPRSQQDQPSESPPSESSSELSLEPSPDSSLPKLYDAWFEPTHQLANQVRGAVDLAYLAGVRKLELQWPVVPNLEELAAGTLLNFEFGQQVSRDLGMDGVSEYPLIKRYLAQFCNLYWVKQIAQAECFRNRIVWAVSSDGVNKEKTVGQLKNVKLASLKRPPTGDIGKDDIVVVIDPRGTDIWIKGCKLLPEGGDGAVVFLNSQFNETYGLTGPRKSVLKGTEPVYFLKRVTRGYIYRTYPGKWLAYLEKPDLSVEVVGEFEGLPKLSEAAKIVREVSNNRYGGFYNDRYVRGFGGRL